MCVCVCVPLCVEVVPSDNIETLTEDLLCGFNAPVFIKTHALCVSLLALHQHTHTQTLLFSHTHTETHTLCMWAMWKKDQMVHVFALSVVFGTYWICFITGPLHTPRSFSLSLYLSLSLCHSLSVSLSLSLCHSLSVSISLSLCHSLSVSFILSISLNFSVSFSLSLPLYPCFTDERQS